MRFPRQSLDVQGDSEEEFPCGDRVDMLVWGVGVSLFFLGFGTHGIIAGESPWPLGEFPYFEKFHGKQAIALCGAFIAAGLGLHFHYVWGIRKVRMPYIYGRRAAAYIAIFCLGFLLCSMVYPWFDLAR